MNILKEKQNKMAAGFSQNDSDVKKKYVDNKYFVSNYEERFISIIESGYD